MMKKKLSTITFIACCISAVMSPVASSAPPENPNLTRFGYYHADQNFYADGTNESSRDHLDQMGALGNCNTAIFANGARYYSSDTGYPKLLNYLRGAAGYGMKVWMHVFDIFFTGTGGLKPDYASAWNNFIAKINQTAQMGTVLGFYIDEPDIWHVSEADFHTATQYIRNNSPSGKKLLTVVSRHAIVGGGPGLGEISSTYLQYCTDAGYDAYYASWTNPSESMGYQPGLFQKFKNQKATTQDLWVIPRVFKTTQNNGFDHNNNPYNDIANWYSLAKNESRVVGMMNYSFASYTDTNVMDIGADQLFDSSNPYYDANLKAKHIEIGQEIIPEPMTILLLLTGLCGMFTRRRISLN